MILDLLPGDLGPASGFWSVASSSLGSRARGPEECWGGACPGWGWAARCSSRRQLSLFCWEDRLLSNTCLNRIGAWNSGIQQSSARSAAGWPLKPVDLEFGEVVIEPDLRRFGVDLRERPTNAVVVPSVAGGLG